jgi:acetyltransferase-like isoleucine patch superfamily enzyme
MPVDRQHAFASGMTYPIGMSRWQELGLVRRGLARLTRYLTELQAGEAAASFAANAIVGADCRVGQDAWCANAGPRESIRLGARVICRGILRTEIFQPGTIVIGDNVYIGDDCILSCAHQIEIGSWTLLAHGVQVFDNDSHPLEADLRGQDYRQAVLSTAGRRSAIQGAPIWIGARAWVGINAIILKGVTIGEGGIVAAGSVVTQDVAPYTVVAGNPAKVVKQLVGPRREEDSASDVT